jgi:chromosomal replication initiation ATPase DnaA
MEMCLGCGRPMAKTRAEVVQIVLNEIADRHGVQKQLLTSDLRNEHLVRARQEAYSELYSLGFSSSHIGRILNRDHSTVLHGIKRHTERMRRVDAMVERKEKTTASTRSAEGATR